MANITSYGLQEQLNPPMINLRLNVFHIKPLQDRYFHMEVKFVPSQKEGGNMLRILERRTLRIIYGPINDSGMWRTRYSKELDKLYDELDIAKVLNIGRLR